MTPAHCFKSRSLILATVLVCGLGLFTHANAQIRPTHAFLVDLNSSSATVIDLGTLGNFPNFPDASGINDAGQVVGPLTRLKVMSMPSSLVLMAWG